MKNSKEETKTAKFVQLYDGIKASQVLSLCKIPHSVLFDNNDMIITTQSHPKVLPATQKLVKEYEGSIDPQRVVRDLQERKLV